MQGKDISLIAYCGVNCAVCSDYLSGKCHSCRRTDWSSGERCMPVDCCVKRGISLCAQCVDFPCEDMKEFYGESESHKDAYRLMCSMRAEDKQ